LQITTTRLALFRILFLLLFLLPVFLASSVRGGVSKEGWLSLILFGSELLLSLLYTLTVLRYPLLEIHEVYLFFQLLLDSLFVFALTLYSGGIQSPFFSIYFFIILMASLSLRPRLAITFSLLLSLFPVTTSYLSIHGFIPGTKPLRSTPEFFNQLLLKDLGYILIFLILGIAPSHFRFRLTKTQLSLRDLEKSFLDLKLLYTLILEKIPSGLVLLTEEGKPQFVNPYAAQLLEKVEEKERHRLFQEVTRKGEDPRGEIELKSEGGKRSLFGYSFTPLPPLSWGRYLLVFQDLTTIKELEEREREEARLRTLVRLAQNLAHELRNPLGAIHNSLELLKEDPNLTPVSRELMEIHAQETQRLEALIRNFLAYARPEPRWIRPISLSFICKGFCKRYAQHDAMGKKRLHIRGDPDLLVLADEDLLRQALDNLLLNALQWSPEGEEVTVSWEKTSKGVEILIHNRGPAIPPEYHRRIFEPFFSLRPGGSGLGLAIAWSQIQALKGSLELARSDHHGTTFRVILPEGKVESDAIAS
jgi:two-component system sensor histidine kinase PilS (NtrC family)